MIRAYQRDSYDWVRTQPDKSYDHIVTDPVYGIPFDLPEWRRICRGNIIVFNGAKFPPPFEPDEKAYWIKPLSTKNFSKHLGRFVEEIFISRGGNAFNGLHWSQMSGVYSDLLIESRTLSRHPWEKPMTLIERLVRIYTNSGDLVLDPFCGSGTVLLACKNLSRSCIGLDINKTWVNQINRKLKET
jgi:DNA modification methylase